MKLSKTNWARGGMSFTYIATRPELACVEHKPKNLQGEW